MGKNKVPWGPLAAMGVATALVGGGAYVAYDWTVSPTAVSTTATALVTSTTLSLSEQVAIACDGLIDGYVEYATRVLGPPPAGWTDDAKASCIETTTPFIADGTSKFTDYCTGWNRGQEVAKQTAKVDLPFAPCP